MDVLWIFMDFSMFFTAFSMTPYGFLWIPRWELQKLFTRVTKLLDLRSGGSQVALLQVACIAASQSLCSSIALEIFEVQGSFGF